MNPYSLRPILATSRNHSYDFFMPLTVLMWRKVVGAEPIVILSETEQEWSEASGKVIRQALKEIEIPYTYVGKIEGYDTGQCAQSARQHVCAMKLDESEVLMTADVDMWPLSKDWYYLHDPNKWAVSLHYANAYGWPYPPYFCTNYVAATTKVWREIMGINETGEIATQLQASFDRHLGRYHDSWSAWNFDELFFGARLVGSQYFPDRCQMILRGGGGPPDKRIDRSGWPMSYDWSKEWIDTHLIRPGAVHDNWIRIRPMLEHFLPERMAWIDAYMLSYRRARYYGQ